MKDTSEVYAEVVVSALRGKNFTVKTLPSKFNVREIDGEKLYHSGAQVAFLISEDYEIEIDFDVLFFIVDYYDKTNEDIKNEITHGEYFEYAKNIVYSKYFSDHSEDVFFSIPRFFLVVVDYKKNCIR